MTAEFLITSLIVILLPGTGVIYTLAIGLGRGFKASVVAAFGCTLGIIPAASASIIGLAAIFHTSAMAFLIVKYLGAAYLLYLAWNMLKDGGTLDIREDRKPASIVRTAVNGLLINILNPKLSLFFLAFLPQFADAKDPGATLLMVELAAIFMALTFIVFVGYGAFASAIRRHIITRPAILTWMKRSFAVTFGLLSLKLALSDR